MTRQFEHARKTGQDRDLDASNTQFFGYESPETRLAYLLFRVPKHATMIGTALSSCHEQLSASALGCSEPQDIIITSIGGGPGSDFLGILKYLTEFPNPHRIKIVVVDCKNWEPIWPAFQTALSKSEYANISVQFVEGDATSSRLLSVVPESTHVYLFSYFLVEMLPFAGQFGGVFRSLVWRAQPGAVFISLDPNGEEREAFIQKRLKEVAS